MRTLLIVFCSIWASTLFANGLEISNPTYIPASNKIIFEISWSNAWKVPTTGANTSSDGAWVFLKYAPNGGAAWQHLDITAASTSLANFNATVGNNGHGVMLVPDYCSGVGSGCAVSNVTVTLVIDNIIGANPDFKIFGMEMVKVPSDPFYLGDGVSDRTYYSYPDTLDHYYVNSSSLISSGTGSGDLHKKDGTFNTNVPANYPKGYREFWAMKYKISMEQYTEFLNTLDRVGQNNRTDTDISGNTITNVFVMTDNTTPYQRNPIRCDANLPAGPAHFYCDLDNDGVPNESNDGQNLIANHLSREDFLAYMDWAALRPYSNMELEKMSRGPLNPVAGEYAWGSSTYASPGNLVDDGQNSETFDNVGSAGPIWPDFYATNFTGGRCGFAANATSTRLSAGATFYGILDVHSSGHLLFCESTGNLNNFHYFNSQGDGTLSSNAEHNVGTWSSMTLHIFPSYFHDTVSDGNTFTLTAGSRASYGSGRGVVILQP